MEITTIFYLVVLIFSVIIHEVAHGLVADSLGDPTARLAGRLTLSPVPHIDPMGSVILPAIMLLASAGSFAFGWAKPVPYNPYNLKNVRVGTFLVAIAGVSANFLMAIIFGLILRFHAELGLASGPFLEMLGIIVFVNVILGVFNLIPMPPLDGAKVLFSMLPYRFQYIHDYFERNWIISIILVLLFAGDVVVPIARALFQIITGVGM